MGLLEDSEIREASGIVESRKNPHVLWVHNDRNNQNRLFAINTNGKTLAVYYLDGIVNRDWEDIAIGPGPTGGIDYLYIGDVGDNNAEYDLKYIYRVPEPDVHFMQEPVTETLYGTETITCQYPDGIFDSETIMLDPLTKDLYIVTKRETDNLRLYRAAWPQSTSEVIVMDHTATLSHSQLVAGGYLAGRTGDTDQGLRKGLLLEQNRRSEYLGCAGSGTCCCSLYRGDTG